MFALLWSWLRLKILSLNDLSELVRLELKQLRIDLLLALLKLPQQVVLLDFEGLRIVEGRLVLLTSILEVSLIGRGVERCVFWMGRHILSCLLQDLLDCLHVKLGKHHNQLTGFLILVLQLAEVIVSQKLVSNTVHLVKHL